MAINTPTIRDVAETANVSIATVSRILNGNSGYSEKTRERVLQVIDVLGYQRNENAHSLKAKTSHTIAVLVPETGSFYSMMLENIEIEARKLGYTIAICHTGKNGRDCRRYSGLLSNGTVCGAIVLSLPPECGVDHILMRAKLPCIFVNSLSKLYKLPFVCIDHFQGLYEATRYLLSIGHRRIAIVTGEIQDQMTTKPRIEGYRWALRQAGIEPDPMLQANGSYEYEGALTAFRDLWNATQAFSAVVTCSDEAALAVMHVVIHSGKKVPEDLSVIGFDDSRMARIVTPSMTSVSIPYQAIIYEALANLHAQIVDGSDQGSRLIPLSLAIRESTRQLPFNE